MPSSVTSRFKLSLFTALGAAALVLGSCADGDPEQSPTTTSEPTSSSSSPSSTTGAPETTADTTSSPTPVTATPDARPAAVGEGAPCSPRGAVATFSDGSTAHCARLQYTDGSAWSRDPSLAPNPAVQHQAPTGLQLGDQCIGADIGRTGVDASGNSIVCDNYMWVLDLGQRPSHPWVDDQVRWSECMETNTIEACRETLNPAG